MKIKLIILFFLSWIFLTSCNNKTQPETKTRKYKSKLNLKENLSDFTHHMNKKDTIKILANLSMEWWIRTDELIVTKNDRATRIQTTVKEDTTYEMKFQMRTVKMEKLSITNSDNKFESHFAKRVERTKLNGDDNWIFKIINQKDTLTFYTKGLGDKGGEVMEYFDFMDNYYSNNTEFQPINIVDENK